MAERRRSGSSYVLPSRMLQDHHRTMGKAFAHKPWTEALLRREPEDSPQERIARNSFMLQVADCATLEALIGN